MAKIKCFVFSRYEVKLKNKPLKKFFDREEALTYIDENKENFDFMQVIATANIKL